MLLPLCFGTVGRADVLSAFTWNDYYCHVKDSSVCFQSMTGVIAACKEKHISRSFLTHGKPWLNQANCHTIKKREGDYWRHECQNPANLISSKVCHFNIIEICNIIQNIRFIFSTFSSLLNLDGKPVVTSPRLKLLLKLLLKISQCMILITLLPLTPILTLYCVLSHS